MKRRRFLGVALAGTVLLFFVTLGVVTGLQQRQAPDPIFRLQIRADLGTWILLGSATLSLGSLLLVAGQEGIRYFLRRARMNAQQECALARRRFVRRLDHELRNSLSVIRAQLAYLSEHPNGDSLQPVVDDILAQIERLGGLTASLRRLAELEEYDIENLPVDVALLLQEVVEAIQIHPDYPTRRIRLLLSQAPWPLPPVGGDRDLLFQAFYNLLDNALKFTQPGDGVEIRAFEEGRVVVVEVADTGCGIAPDDLPYIFEELYRGANARGREGSGLGLALVRAVAERHGGAISVRSRPGRGTVFTIRLPIAS